MAWSYILAAVGVFGLWLVGRYKAWWTWLVGVGAQVLWIIYAVVTQQWGFIVSAIAYGWVYTRNALRWRADVRLTPVPDRAAPDGGSAARAER